MSSREIVEIESDYKNALSSNGLPMLLFCEIKGEIVEVIGKSFGKGKRSRRQVYYHLSENEYYHASKFSKIKDLKAYIRDRKLDILIPLINI